MTKPRTYVKKDQIDAMQLVDTMMSQAAYALEEEIHLEQIEAFDAKEAEREEIKQERAIFAGAEVRHLVKVYSMSNEEAASIVKETWGL